MVTPSHHQCLTLLTQVPAAIRSLGLVLDRVREHELRKFVCKAGLLGRPVAERRPQFVRGHVELHPPDSLQEHHV
jgi:hypothetical protein